MPVLLLALTFSLSALPPPPKVHVLSRDKPYEVTLEAATMACDGKEIASSSVRIHLKDQRLEAGAKLCDVVTAQGGFKITQEGGKARSFPGKLTAIAEGTVIRFINEVEV